MNDGVCSDALVMPSRTGSPKAGFLPPRRSLLLTSSSSILSTLLADDVADVARIGDVDLLQHLADDHLDVLVVDDNALQPVDFLDLVDEVGSQRLHALDRQDVVRRRIAVEDVVALLDVVTFLKMERLALRDQVFDRLDAVFGRLDDDATLVLVVAAEADRAVDLSDDGVVLRTTSLEQFRNTRQTTGDVLGLGAFQRRTCEHVTLADLWPGLDRQDRVDRQHEAGLATACQLQRSCRLSLMTIAGFRSAPRGVERQSMT